MDFIFRKLKKIKLFVKQPAVILMNFLNEYPGKWAFRYGFGRLKFLECNGRNLKVPKAILVVQNSKTCKTFFFQKAHLQKLTRSDWSFGFAKNEFNLFGSPTNLLPGKGCHSEETSVSEVQSILLSQNREKDKISFKTPRSIRIFSTKS